MDDILKPGEKLASEVLETLGQKFGTVLNIAGTPQRTVLSKQDQLNLFLNMSEGELHQVKERVGISKFNAYVNSMMRLAGKK